MYPLIWIFIVCVMSVSITHAECGGWAICPLVTPEDDPNPHSRFNKLDGFADDVHAQGYYYNWIEILAQDGEDGERYFRSATCLEGEAPLTTDVKRVLAKADCTPTTHAAIEAAFSTSPFAVVWDNRLMSFVEGASKAPYDTARILREFDDSATTNAFGP